MPEPADRTCGGCTACCYTHSVSMDGVSKTFYSLCTHCTVGVGCGIYDKRPRSCQVYKCLWRGSSLPEHLRPDRSGIIIDIWPYESVSVTFLAIWEVVPGSFEKPDVREFTSRMFATGKYILWHIKADSDRLEFPESVDQETRDYLTRQFSDEYRTLTKKPA